jgi:hypothetical protein
LKKGVTIPDEDFWLNLREHCDLTIEQAKNLAPNVLNAFKEDFKFIKVGESYSKPDMNQENQTNMPSSQATSSDLIDITYGKYKVILPSNEEEAKEVWSKMKKMLDPLYSTNPT